MTLNSVLLKASRRRDDAIAGVKVEVGERLTIMVWAGAPTSAAKCGGADLMTGTGALLPPIDRLKTLLRRPLRGITTVRDRQIAIQRTAPFIDQGHT